MPDEPQTQKTTRMDDLIGEPEVEETDARLPLEEVKQVDPTMEVQECGLPLHFCGRGSKMKIVRYVTQYEISHRDRQNLQLTNKERALFKLYRHKIGALAAPMDYFTAALRLWTAEHPIARPAPADLNSFKVT